MARVKGDDLKQPTQRSPEEREALIKKYMRNADRTAYSWARSRDQYDDYRSELYLTLVQVIDSPTTEKVTSTYINACLTHGMIQIFRKNSRQKCIPARLLRSLSEPLPETRDSADEEMTYLDVIPDVSVPNPEEIAIANQESERLRRVVRDALNVLPATQRDVVVHVIGLNGHEPSTLPAVEAELGLKSGTAWGYLQRAKRVLREPLKDWAPGSTPTTITKAQLIESMSSMPDEQRRLLHRVYGIGEPSVDADALAAEAGLSRTGLYYRAREARKTLRGELIKSGSGRLSDDEIVEVLRAAA